MNSISSSIPTSKKSPYYVYTLAYPESMTGYIFYIGKGKGNRIYEHEIAARRSTATNSYKTNIIRKVERNSERIVRTKLAFFEDETDAFLYETALIFFMRPYGHLANLTDGGEGASGITHVCPEELKRRYSEMYKGKPGPIISEEGKRRIGEAGRERVYSEENRQRRREIALERIMSEEERRKRGEAASSPTNIERLRYFNELRAKGEIKHSDETIQRIVETRKKRGYRHSEETKEKMRRYHPSEETRKKISQSNKGRVGTRKGVTLSEETKQKMREAGLKRVISEETKYKMSESAKRRVHQRDVNGRFGQTQSDQIITQLQLWEEQT